jgi:hypothetical protein
MRLCNVKRGVRLIMIQIWEGSIRDAYEGSIRTFNRRDQGKLKEHITTLVTSQSIITVQ